MEDRVPSHEGISIIIGTVSHAFAWVAVQHGKISHCKAFNGDSSCMECKDSNTIAPAKSGRLLTTFKWKQ